MKSYEKFYCNRMDACDTKGCHESLSLTIKKTMHYVVQI